MKSLTFYYQKRKDGGTRIGVELNGNRVLENFKPWRALQDSALEWFVDLRFKGRNIPQDPEAIRAWLVNQSSFIQHQLAELAKELQTGIDPDWPVTSKTFTLESGTTFKIVCSAIRRLTGRDIDDVLNQLRRTWPRLLKDLQAFDSELAA